MNDQYNIEQFLLEINDFRIVKEIAYGIHGEVDLIERETPTGEKNQYIQRRIVGSEKFAPDSGRFLKEINFFFIVRPHPCIVKFYGYFFNPCSIVVEYVQNGSLQEMFKKMQEGTAPKEWDDTARAKAIFGLTAAMQHLHSYNIVHRDLNLKNILLDDNYEIKLTDFGLAKLDDTQMSAIHSQPIYTAPEAFCLNEEKPNYDETVDIYAFGIILYQIITGKEPYEKYKPHEFPQLVIDGLRPQIPTDIDSDIQKLLKCCWDGNPENRPTSIDILRFFYAHKAPLLPETKLKEYKSYVDSVLLSTNINEDEKDFFLSPVATESRQKKFQEILNDANTSNNLEDLYKLACLYDTGYGTLVDPATAFEYYSQAASKGHLQSMYKVSKYLRTGRGTTIDLKKSNEILKECSDQGYEEAKLEYAKRILKGIGFDHPKPKDALELFEELSNEPHKMKEAMFECSLLLLRPPKVSDEPDQKITFDKDRGVNYLKESAEKGYIPAQQEYAGLLLEGKLVPQNIEEGISIYKTTAEQGAPMALYVIGNCYELGKFGFEKSMKKAITYYEKAANKNLPLAMARLANIFEKGIGVEQDLFSASHYYQMAAEMGQRDACHKYANFLLEGIGSVKMNILEAIEYYKKAGKPASYYKLGEIYLGGSGVVRDIELAKEYYQKAADMGYKAAQQELDKINEE